MKRAINTRNETDAKKNKCQVPEQILGAHGPAALDLPRPGSYCCFQNIHSM